MPTMAAVHHKERLPRIVSGPSRLPPRGVICSGILERYHVSVDKSVKSMPDGLSLQLMTGTDMAERLLDHLVGTREE